jgi:hypothetical protein
MSRDKKIVKYKDGRKRKLSTWNEGAGYTKDRKSFNKSEDWEIPLNERAGAKSSSSKSKTFKRKSSSGSEPQATKGKNYSYIPNAMLREAEIENKGKTTYIDAKDILDGIYVKAGTKYASGGGVGRKKRVYELLDEVTDYSQVNKKDIPKSFADEAYEKELDDDEIQTKINKHLISIGYEYDSNNYLWVKKYASGGGVGNKYQVNGTIKIEREDGGYDTERVNGTVIAENESDAEDKVVAYYERMYGTSESDMEINLMISKTYESGGGVGRKKRVYELLDEVTDYSQVNKKDIPKSFADEDEIQTKINKHLISIGYEYDSNNYLWVKTYASGGGVGKKTQISQIEVEDELNGKEKPISVEKISNEFYGITGINYIYDNNYNHIAVMVYTKNLSSVGVSELNDIQKRLGADDLQVSMMSLNKKLDGDGIIYILFYKNGKKYSKGGRVKDYKYVPNYMIESVTVERNGKETEIDADRILDGLYVKGKVKFEDGGEFDYGSDLTDEAMVKQNLVNGEISCETLKEIIGCKPEYPIQIVGAIKLEKCFLRNYYRLA